jgi:hypothetical protein
MLTQAILKETFNYDPLTGNFTWLTKTNTKVVVGSAAGFVNQRGYVMIGFLGKEFSAHRLAFLYMTGKLPVNLVDHIDRVRDNNKWDNLREANSGQNGINQIATKSESGLRGVHEVKRINSSNKFVAKCKSDGKTKHIGTFSDKLDAALAYQIYVFKTYGDFLPSVA